MKAASYHERVATSGLDLFADYYATYDRNHVISLLAALREDGQPTHPPFISWYERLTDQPLPDDKSWIDLLTSAITKRRRQFRYWQRHRQKLGGEEKPKALPTYLVLVAADARAENAPGKLPSATGDNKSQSAVEKSVHASTQATEYKPKSALNDIETQSVISFATTARDIKGRSVNLPLPPRAARDDRDFECPYCHVICSARHGTGKAWR